MYEYSNIMDQIDDLESNHCDTSTEYSTGEA